MLSSSDSVDLTLRPLQSADRTAWDQLVQSLPGSCFMQAWAWADFKQLEGFQVFRYGVFTSERLMSERLIGGGLFYLYPQPPTPTRPTPTLLFAPGAPLFQPEYARAGMPLLLQQAEQLAQQTGAIALRIEPLLTESPDYLQGFVRAPVDLLPSETWLVDLQPALSAILAAMKPKGRYNIRLSQRQGIAYQFTQDAQAIPTFYDLFWQTAQRQQFFAEPYSFFINLCQTLFAANLAEIGLAYWQNQILATVLIVYWGNRATYLYGGRSLEQPHRMAPYGLHWTAIQRAKARGCQVYDFYGYTHDPDHGYARFSQFKRQFGGIPITTIGAQDYFFYEQLADTIVAVLKRLF